MSFFCCCAPAEVFLAMCTHALTTEAEEVMGLLLGDIRVRAVSDHHLPMQCIWPKAQLALQL